MQCGPCTNKISLVKSHEHEQFRILNRRSNQLVEGLFRDGPVHRQAVQDIQIGTGTDVSEDKYLLLYIC